MSRKQPRSIMAATAVILGLTGVLTLHAVTVHSLAPQPEIYRTTANNNDLDSVEGFATPGKTVELWYRQRNFVEGAPNNPNELFSWCGWKNAGIPLRLAVTQADAHGIFRISNLRLGPITVSLFPAGPKEDRCLSGLYTELLPKVCDAPGLNCTSYVAPVLHWLNVRHTSSVMASTSGAVSLAYQAAAAVADGPDTGSAFGDAQDVDQNFIDTSAPGLVLGQRVSWQCGPGGTSMCPSVAVHDATTMTTTDVEYPYVLGTMQAHRPGGSFFAAAAIPRGQPLGFAATVNVNVRLRGRIDVNMGCDAPNPFSFFRGLTS